ncbi:MAG TPA: hypothetical protein VMX57_06120, partial [Planctomycetota bacterium]|nr:hypothetical protein [Planctomycetota bacterium]
MTLLAAWSLCGCQTSPPPPQTHVEYNTQHNLLQKAMGRLENSPSARDEETLKLLKQLETELADAQERHAAAQREIARLNREVQKLRLAAGFAVDRIEIQFYTHATDKGIELGVTPYDRHDDVVKTAGDFNIALYQPGMLRTLGTKIAMWQFSAKEVEKLWTGELYQGYAMKLAWPDGKVPDVGKTVLRVEFTTAEGKTFGDTKELDVREATP